MVVGLWHTSCLATGPICKLLLISNNHLHTTTTIAAGLYTKRWRFGWIRLQTLEEFLYFFETAFKVCFFMVSKSKLLSWAIKISLARGWLFLELGYTCYKHSCMRNFSQFSNKWHSLAQKISNSGPIFGTAKNTMPWYFQVVIDIIHSFI